MSAGVERLVSIHDVYAYSLAHRSAQQAPELLIELGRPVN
jgi:hypothetical protein